LLYFTGLKLTHVSIIFQEVIPRDKSFATHRASFSSKYVSNQTEMNFTKVREVFVHNRQRMKKPPSVFTQVSWFWRNVKNTVATRELLHFWSDLGKINFSPSWSVQMTFLMSQMITRQKYISNELS
jgi:hypothetical protein